jgi:hypothetical protein
MLAAEGQSVSIQTLTVDVPTPLFERLRQQARGTNSTVEAEVVNVLAASVAPTAGSPFDTASL